MRETIGNSEKNGYIGRFKINEKSFFGQLTVDGSKSKLKVLFEDKPAISGQLREIIQGTLSNGEAVTLVDPYSSGPSMTYSVKTGRQYNQTFIPKYILSGSSHYDPSIDLIESISYTTESAVDLYYDWGTFGYISFDGEVNKKIIEDFCKDSDEKIEATDHAEIHYFSGKLDILEVEHEYLTIKVSHMPSLTVPTVRGYSMENKVGISINFKKPINLEEAISWFYKVKMFNDTLWGKHEPYTDVEIKIPSKDEKPVWLQLQILLDENKCNEPERFDLHLALINGGLHKSEYCSTLAHWLERHNDFLLARNIVYSNHDKPNSYDSHRLVAVSNAFDHIPKELTGFEPKVGSELGEAVKKCRKELKAAPNCDQRNALLQALGRVGKKNLSSIIQHRAKIVTESFDFEFNELTTVIKHAVKSRNHLVHGTQGSLTQQQLDHYMIFFTNVLEFVFIASDLIECGFDIKRWHESKGSYHQFAYFLRSYDKNVRSLIRTLERNKNNS